MKKSLITMGIVILSSIILPITAVAAEYTSNGAIIFETDNDLTKPVDPVDPTDPMGPNPGTAGPLSIDFASSFQFGNQKITSETMDYYAKLQEFTSSLAGPNYVQVTDKRGTQEGWSLSVIQNGQFKTAQSEVLAGASLSISSGTAISVTDKQYAPTVVENHTFVPNSEMNLVNVPAGKGMGTWIYRFGADASEGAAAVKLNIPGRSVKLAKEYRTTLIWYLKNVPETE
ncbi:WxL domain-containing protein [Enterococcus gallinarum]|uniref:WxL domain-containing protein n=1 Tax=Enterococcus gallinarum TaxID=1353 RepID=UPI0009BDD1BF|nr:WxL domain-containing protein [Enterococcus gallinarum]NCE15709.1 WxL domain-containing protein [Enterococcus gallinarum]OQO80799.1 cell surface protein [Enterococcus gallinarum]